MVWYVMHDVHGRLMNLFLIGFCEKPQVLGKPAAFHLTITSLLAPQSVFDKCQQLRLRKIRSMPATTQDAQGLCVCVCMCVCMCVCVCMCAFGSGVLWVLGT